MNIPTHIDHLTFEQAMMGTQAPEDVQRTLTLLSIPYWGFDHREHIGQIVVDKQVANEVVEIFQTIFTAKFPIEKMIPISAYDWSDDASMADNNSSAFNYRFIYGTDRLSNHSLGRAIDINPMQNPYIAIDQSVHPSVSTYNKTKPGTILDHGIVVQTFEKYGWEWGGRWINRKDYQHFEKVK